MTYRPGPNSCLGSTAPLRPLPVVEVVHLAYPPAYEARLTQAHGTGVVAGAPRVSCRVMSFGKLVLPDARLAELTAPDNERGKQDQGDACPEAYDKQGHCLLLRCAEYGHVAEHTFHVTAQLPVGVVPVPLEPDSQHLPVVYQVSAQRLDIFPGSLNRRRRCAGFAPVPAVPRPHVPDSLRRPAGQQGSKLPGGHFRILADNFQFRVRPGDATGPT